MAVLIPVHAAGAVIALLLGGYNLRRRPRGDRLHRRVGLAWAIAMYWTVLSSFAIRELRPGHFSWIHGLSVFTFVTLTIGLWGGRTGRARLHRQFLTGSYLGLLGAFVGAVAVPQRWLPQLAVDHPFLLLAGLVGCALVATAVIRPRRPPARPHRRVAAGVPGTPVVAGRRAGEGAGVAGGRPAGD